MAKKKAMEPFEGTVETVNIFGRESETSHHCQFRMVSTDGKSAKTFLLDPFKYPARYRALLRLLVDACLNHSATTVSWRVGKGGPFVYGITTLQSDGTSRRRSSRRKAIGDDVWSSIGKVAVVKAGTAKASSSFTVDEGSNTPEFELDSLQYPVRAAAMMQVVAAALGAGATLRVKTYGENKKQIAFEIEMGPFQAP